MAEADCPPAAPLRSVQSILSVEEGRVIHHPVRAAALALIVILAGCAAAYVVAPLAERGAGLLPLVAAVAIATAAAGAAWGLLVYAVGAAFALLFVMPADTALFFADPAQHLTLVLFAMTALLVLAAIASLRARLGRLDDEYLLLEESFERIGEGVLTTDAAGRVARMNRRAERLTGWRALDARGKPLAQILRFASAGEPPTAPPERLHGGESPLSEACTLVASDGSEHSVLPLIAPVPRPHGDGGRVILLRDATAWQRTERELRALVAELWSANRQKDEALAALASGGRADREETRSADIAPLAAPAGEERRQPPPLRVDPDTQPFHQATEVAPDSRVLMLCDDSDSAFALSMLLGMAGYDVKTAASAPEALDHAARFAPQVALIDTTMSDTDGLAAAKALRRVCAELDLVALTNPEQRPDARELAEAGYTIAVPKTEPLALKRWLAGRRAA